jgi:hypothetical protein
MPVNNEETNVSEKFDATRAARIRLIVTEFMAAMDQFESDIENADSLETAVALADQAYEIQCRAGEILINAMCKGLVV